MAKRRFGSRESQPSGRLRSSWPLEERNDPGSSVSGLEGPSKDHRVQCPPAKAARPSAPSPSPGRNPLSRRCGASRAPFFCALGRGGEKKKTLQESRGSLPLPAGGIRAVRGGSGGHRDTSRGISHGTSTEDGCRTTGSPAAAGCSTRESGLVLLRQQRGPTALAPSEARTRVRLSSNLRGRPSAGN